MCQVCMGGQPYCASGSKDLGVRSLTTGREEFDATNGGGSDKPFLGTVAGSQTIMFRDITGDGVDDLAKWGEGTLGTSGGTVTYSFSPYIQGGGDDEGEFRPLSAVARDMMVDAFRMISDVADIAFEWADTGNFDTTNSYSGDIVLSQYGTGYYGSGVGGFDDAVRTYGEEGYSIRQGFADLGGVNLGLYLHEAMHALGLHHPGGYNGGFPSYENVAEFWDDTEQFTVMSYFSETNTGADFGNRPDTGLALYDVFALQQMYGTNTTTRAGDTVYGFNATARESDTGAIDDFWSLSSSSDDIVGAVWDAGGIDTLDLSGFSTSSEVDLREEAFSSFGGLTYNFSIARGAVIENATGGAGDDLLSGNASDNVLIGGAGDDELFGDWGDDILDGGEGVDTATFEGSFSEYDLSSSVEGIVQVSWLYGPPEADVMVDLLSNVEFARFDDLTVDLADYAEAPLGDFDSYTLTASPDALDLVAGDDARRLFSGSVLDFADGVSATLTGSMNAIAFDNDGGDYAWNRMVLRSDFDDAAWWASSRDYFDASGVRYASDFVRDNGWTQTNAYEGGVLVSTVRLDAENSESWSRVVLSYDATSGAKTSYEITRDNGLRQTDIYDEAGNTVRRIDEDTADIRYWSSIDVTLDDGRVVERRIANDNGRTDEYVYDDAGNVVRLTAIDGGERYNWERVINNFDADGTRIDRTFEYDSGYDWTYAYEDGRIVRVTRVDADDRNNWNEITTLYDDNDQREQKSITYDTGRTDEYVYDAAGNVVRLTAIDGGERYNWDRVINNFDADGTRIDRTFEYDSGYDWTYAYEDGRTARVTRVDSEDQVDWSEITTLYDENDQRTQKTITYDDGRIEVFNYEEDFSVV